MSKYNWLAIQGKAEIGDNQITYIPKFSKEAPEVKNKGSWESTAHLKSNGYFDSGEISFNVLFEERNTGGCMVCLNDGTDVAPIKIGIHNDGYLFSVAKINNNQWDFLQTIGSSEEMIPYKEYNFRLIVHGSTVSLFIDDIEVININERIKKSQVQLHFHGFAKIVLSDFKIVSQQKKAFVVMQFSEEYNDLYKDVIKPVAEENGDLICERADEYFTATPILRDIENSIKEASVVIADITPNNANVFYEVGYSHAIGKPTILLCDKKGREKLPFDLSGFRTLFYDNSIAGKGQIEDKLRKYLKAAF
jgi:DNA-binding cell septation regulator SpoVG